MAFWYCSEMVPTIWRRVRMAYMAVPRIRKSPAFRAPAATRAAIHDATIAASSSSTSASFLPSTRTT